MKISVITVTYNCATTVSQALASVAAQDYEDVEHVIVDGASCDGTWMVIQSRRSPRVVAFSEPDRGIYDALNKGIARSSGHIIGFLHADDLFADARVLSSVAEAMRDPSVHAVYGDLEYVRNDDVRRVIREWRSRPFSVGLLKRGWMPPHPTLYVRRSVYERLGGYDTNYRIAADYEFILRLFSTPGLRTVYIPRVLVRMRAGGISNRSLGNLIRKSAEDYRALRFHRIGGFGALAWKNLSKLVQFL